MENNKNAFVDKWSSVYFFIPLFEKPIVMPTAEEFCSKLSEKFGRVTELSEEQKMPEDPAGLKSFVLWDHLVHYSKENQDLPSQLMIYGADEFLSLIHICRVLLRTAGNLLPIPACLTGNG